VPEPTRNDDWTNTLFAVAALSAGDLAGTAWLGAQLEQRHGRNAGHAPRRHDVDAVGRLAKVGVAGSSPVVRSRTRPGRRGAGFSRRPEARRVLRWRGAFTGDAAEAGGSIAGSSLSTSTGLERTEQRVLVAGARVVAWNPGSSSASTTPGPPSIASG